MLLVMIHAVRLLVEVGMVLVMVSIILRGVQDGDAVTVAAIGGGGAIILLHWPWLLLGLVMMLAMQLLLLQQVLLLVLLQLCS
jgi:hypothetical protein